MRPAYESEQDVTAEARLALWFGDKFGFCIVKSKKFSPFDYYLQSQHDYSWVGNLEVKVRSCSSDTYPTYKISSTKVEHASIQMAVFKIPTWIVVEWRDKIGRAALHDLKDTKLVIWGRKDRRDWQDIESAVEIPIEINFRMDW